MARSPHGLKLERTRAGDLLGQRILTKDGKVDVGPADLASAAPRILEQALREQADAGAGLVMIGRRLKLTHNSWSHRAPSLSRGRQSRCVMTMHPDDAADRGLAQGMRARVSTATGSVELSVDLRDEVMRGVVVIPHGFGHRETGPAGESQAHRGPNVNRLAASGPGTLEVFAGMSRLAALEVRVEAAPGPPGAPQR
jgi:anaerobic selenocysteine-containing dehydrogenase